MGGPAQERFNPKDAPGFEEDFRIRRALAVGLRQLRMEKGLSQTEAAGIATFSVATWSNLEIMRHKISKLEYLMAAYRALGMRLRIVVEDIPSPDDAALEAEYAYEAELREPNGTSSEEEVGGDMVRAPAPVDKEESLRGLAQRAFEESQERMPGVHTA